MQGRGRSTAGSPRTGRDVQHAVRQGVDRETSLGKDRRGAGGVGNAYPGRFLGTGRQNVVHLTLGQQPATADDGDGVSHLLHLVQNVTGDEYRLAGVGESPHGGADLMDSGRIESVGRFVEDQQVRDP